MASPKRSSINTRALVLGSLSALLLLAGTATLLLAVLPAIAIISHEVSYQPRLPLSKERAVAEVTASAEEEPHSPESLSVRQIFPPLPTNDMPVAEGNWIRIPSINVTVPLVLSASMNNADVITTLDHGAALYPNGVLPGHLGNTFVAAHSTGEPWKGAYRFAFLKINQIDPGHLIHLDWDGTRYTYQVTGSEIITPKPDFRIVSDRPLASVTLMACWPLWSTSKRMLIHGELVNITKLTTVPA